MSYQYKSFYSFLWFAIKPYKWYYAIMLAAPILGGFYDFLVQYAFKMVIDAFSSDVQVTYRMLWEPIGLFVFAQGLIFVVWRGADIAEWRSEPYVRRTILTTAYEHVQNNPYVFFQNTHAGAITSRIKGILDGYDHFWAAMHHDFTPRVANAVISVCALSVISWKIFLVIACWSICFYLTLRAFSNAMYRRAFERANQRHDLFAFVADNVANIVTVFSFTGRRRELDNLKQKISNGYIPAEIKLYYIDFVAKCVADLLYCFMIVFLLFYMVYLRQQHHVTTGDVVFVMALCVKIGFELWTATLNMQEFIQNMGDFRSACEILRTPSDEPEPHGLKQLVFEEPRIVFDDVSFKYEENEKEVFSNLSLEIRPGEKVGLVGLSGAGKSTLVSLILKYFTVDGGRILISGQDISTCLADSVREHISVIPQDILLFHRSVFDNIRYGKPDATQEEVIQAAKMAKIHDLILSLPDQYDTLVGERGIKLSGGQRQRIAIARAILKAAPILILDEATSSLDTQTEKWVQSSLEMLIGSSTTVLAIAHRLSTLKHMDRILVLEKGRVVQEGHHQSLMERPSVYRKLWDLQQI